VALVSIQRDDHRGVPGLPLGADASPTLDAAEESTVDHRGARNAHLAALEVGSMLAGRFLITRVLGAGGMGTVYVARDATLGREVAIKVHHAASGSQRLRREAVAMARLAHPNVVTVFEVDDFAGRPFVVMEYIAGTTLRAYLAAAPRSVREILAMLIAAGEGLAAAHDAGLVHRDIKPENVLIGSDGRARVGDFGLARELDSSDDPAPAATGSVEDLRTPVTQTGAVLGTPAYMSPEQFAGAVVDARADQFAFCVTAWEALWNERPFAGTSYAQLSAAIGLGERRSPPAAPKVPARVRAALERGLSVDPAERFLGMRELLDAIRPARRRRWRWGAALAGAAIAAGVAALLLGGPGAPSCELAGSEIAALRGDLPELLQRRGAAKIAVKAEALLRGHRDSFRSDARKACLAGRDREWSPDIAARSQRCFAIAARTAALSLAGLDPAHPMAVLRQLRHLQPVDRCRNQTHLASRPPLPSDPAQQAALIEASATLAVGFDAIESHDARELRRTLAALEASPARTDPTIAAGITTLRGWVAYDAGKLAEAQKAFIDAYYAGRAIDDEQTSSVALGLLIGRGPELGLTPAAVSDWLRTAVSDADRIRARSPWLAGKIYLSAARHADLANDAKSALLYIGRARETLDPHDPAQIDIFEVEGAVLIWSGHVDDGIRAYDTAIARRSEYAGDDDPELAQLLSNYASSLLEAHRLNEAMAAAERASQIIAKVPDPDDERIDSIRVTLAAVLISADQDSEASGLLETARAHSVRQLGEASPIIATIDSNLSMIYNSRGEHDRAIAALKSALAIDEKLVGVDALDVANVHYNLAATYRYKKDYAAARASAERAIAILAAKSLGSDRHRIALTMAASTANELHDFAGALELTATALGFPKPAESPETTAWTQLERARALIGVHRGADARPLLTAARTAYSNLEMTERVRQADDLLRQAH